MTSWSAHELSIVDAIRARPWGWAAGVAVAAMVAFALMGISGAPRIPVGFAKANGRIEVERVDIATKFAGRVARIYIREGDEVASGNVVAEMDVAELIAQLTAAKAAVRRARQGIAKAEAEVALREAEHRLSEVELARVADLERKKIATTADLDRRTAQHSVAEANLLGANAAVGDAKAATDGAEAQVAQLEVTIADMSLKAPVDGRVEYKLVQPGTVIAAGSRVATLLDLSDVYMTVFLPTSEAGRVSLGAEARIVLDAAPRYVLPAIISFVAAEAQFTPKTVETANEREKLMYRAKLRIEPELLKRYRDHVKAGLTGEAYVRLDSSKAWPATLAPRLPDAR
jgi:HlyD family secretion protein